MILSEKQREAVAILRHAELDGHAGLDEELFLLISGLIPLVNVDLLITDERKRILLAMRNDNFFEKSWHIPGGCMRYGEDFASRIQKTALSELGTKVLFAPEPLAVRNVIRGDNNVLEHPRERGHNVAILFGCQLPTGFKIDNSGKKTDDNGYLCWFDKLPHDFMKIQKVYDDILESWRKEV